MKLKTMASTLLLSTFLVGGMATEAEAVTLPEPTTHSYSFTAGGINGKGEYLENDAVNITVTMDGYYGKLSSENFGQQLWDNELTDNFLVIAEGSSVVLTLSSDYPEMITNDYLEPGFDTTEYWDWLDYSFCEGAVPLEQGNTGWTTIYSSSLGEDAQLGSTWCFQEKGSNIFTSYAGGHLWEGDLYTLEKTGVNEYTYTPTVNSLALTFINHDFENPNSSCYLFLGNILVIDQEGMDELEETGVTSFCSLTMIEGFPEHSDISFNYPGLLELFGGTTADVTPEPEEEPVATEAIADFKFEDIQSVDEDGNPFTLDLYYNLTNNTDEEIVGYYVLFVGSRCNMIDIHLQPGEVSPRYSIQLAHFAASLPGNYTLLAFDTREERTNFLTKDYAEYFEIFQKWRPDFDYTNKSYSYAYTFFLDSSYGESDDTTRTVEFYANVLGVPYTPFWDRYN